MRFPDRSLNLIGNCVRPEPWLRPPHIRARQSRATKFASALKTCLRTVPGVRAPRAGMRLLSNAFRRGRHYFVARSADQNNAACPRTRWKATSFLPEQVSLPAHLQIRKLFFKKVLAQFSNHRLLSSSLNARVQQSEPRINNIACRSGGIGRRASLRC